jgi:hypothetical protein
MAKAKTVPSNDFAAETAAISNLKPHPRNYRDHGDDQIDHIVESIEEHGVYRNVVIARDDTILAGHGVVLAARKMGMEKIPVYRVDEDPDSPRALKILTGDNEISRLAYIDDRVLSEILKQIKEDDPVGLLGTGYDEQMLAALAFVTRGQNEIKDFDAAKEWVGMPDFDPGSEEYQVVMSFDSAEAREEVYGLLNVGEGVVRNSKNGLVASLRWPPDGRQTMKSLRFEQDVQEA